ncbi:MAG: hypothetical protein JOS17DRAFT_169517 [Linnemannia elongata]|nr:MAG: hypothetical protein JOS17DRAFT_169517 [Linnemannia elongata]
MTTQPLRHSVPPWIQHISIRTRRMQTSPTPLVFRFDQKTFSLQDVFASDLFSVLPWRRSRRVSTSFPFCFHSPSRAAKVGGHELYLAPLAAVPVLALAPLAAIMTAIVTSVVTMIAATAHPVATTVMIVVTIAVTIAAMTVVDVMSAKNLTVRTVVAVTSPVVVMKTVAAPAPAPALLARTKFDIFFLPPFHSLSLSRTHKSFDINTTSPTKKSQLL